MQAGLIQPAYPQVTHPRSPSWDQHAQYSTTVDSRYSQQIYPSPVSPSHPSYARPQEAQLYYPPPREQTYQAASVPLAGHSGCEVMQHDGDRSALQPPPPTSTMPTPTQFYARLAPVSGGGEMGYMQTTSEDGRYGGSLEPQRRPKYGKFVEVNHT